ncbi:MAG: Sulfur carrier protein adenylyltransferase [Myxococcota bacterium]|nr:Sulfur carrier protein adenylyltransferase [Myxococcota bacterium]
MRPPDAILDERALSGPEAAERLAASSVLMIGAGGLGSPALAWLAAAGVGRFTIADGDVVDISNLQRQVLFETADIGRPKARAAWDRLRRSHPEAQIASLQKRLGPDDLAELASRHDVILDGSDNIATKLLANDAAVLSGKPLVYGGILRWSGQLTVVAPGSPCLRCLFPEPEGAAPMNCAEAGVIGALGGVVGSLMALAAARLLCGIPPGLEGVLLIVDALRAAPRRFEFARDPDCPLCGSHPAITRLRYSGGAQPACAAP